MQEWHAIRVRSNFELRTSSFLNSSGYETLAPVYREERQWSDRVKHIEVPLFSGYVLCKLNIQNRLPVLQTPGVVNIVTFGKQFVPVPEEEIAAVQALAASALTTRPWPYLNIGERVTIQRGPLAGVEGILVAVKNEHRLVVSVNLLQRSISAEISLDWVTPGRRVISLPSASVLACRPALAGAV